MGAESDLAIVTLHPPTWILCTPGHEKDAQRIADAMGAHVEVVTDHSLIGFDPDLPQAPQMRITTDPPKPKPKPKPHAKRSHK